MVEIVLSVFVFAIALILFALALSLNKNVHFTRPQSEQIRAGKRGEAAASAIIRQALREGDCYFTNVSIEYDGMPAELDNVIVNKYGVFIIEVKNYKGEIMGGEDDYEWRKYKMTDAGNVYEKNVKNPIKQVKRQVYVLARFLEKKGVRVWISGYCMLLKHNSPVFSEHILNDADDVDRIIHTKGRSLLSEETVSLISALLDQ